MKAFVTVLLGILALMGCASAEKSVRRADLSGDWNFQVDTGANVTKGAIKLIADGSSYRGTLTTDQGNNVLPVRSLSLDGSNMDMVVESPNGKVIFKGTLNEDRRSFQGTVTYYTGQQFPMSGSKL